MSCRDDNGECFHLYAMELFMKTRHVAASLPEFVNRSPEQFIYLDNKSDVSLSSNQRSMFNMFNNISRLFTFNSCAFFSINLLTIKAERSQIAHDIHTMIHPMIGSDASVCVFRYDDEMLFTFVGYELRCILSDWYSIETDDDCLTEKLDIGNVSIDRSRDYFMDMVYMLARKYYLYSQPSTFELFPISFISDVGIEDIDRESINQYTAYELSAPQREFGDDYVEYDEVADKHVVDIDAELDLMLLEMDEDGNSNPFGDEIEPEDEFDQDEPDDEEINGSRHDKYEYESFDPQLFCDPVLMVKFLEKQDQR